MYITIVGCIKEGFRGREGLESDQVTVFLEHQILKDSRRVVRMTMRQRGSMSLRLQLIAAARGPRSEEPSIPREPTSTVISSVL